MTRVKLCLCFIVLFFLKGLTYSNAQNIAFKTNLLYDVSATANLGVEIGLAPKWTLDISGNLNTWSKNDQTRWKDGTA